MGGGLDTFTFKDGGKAYHFSDGDQIITDKNGKYVSSFYSHSLPWHGNALND